MIQTIRIAHIGIPVDDLDRAERFYTQVLGMRVEGRSPNRQCRLKCGDGGVVLFLRPHALNRSSLEEDGQTHQSFEVAPETFDQAVELLKRQGYYNEGPTGPESHRATGRAPGRAVYFIDSEGNYQELWSRT